MQKSRSFLLREHIKKYAKESDYGFILFMVDSLRVVLYGSNYDDCNGEKLFFKQEGSLSLAVYNNREIHSHILNGGFESHITDILRNQIKPGSVCLDVGANIGYYSIFMANLCTPSGSVFAFEPVDYNIKKIELNASLNGLKNINIVNMALGEKREILELNIYPEDSMLTGHNSFVVNETLKKDTSHQKKQIEVISIDEWMSLNKLENVDFVKVDIEGFESSFFKGAIELLKLKPVIFFEHSSERIKELGQNESDFTSYLSEYTCYQILEDGLLEYNFDGNMHPFASDIIAIPKSN
jgi:FkbM family methyltransferase